MQWWVEFATTAFEAKPNGMGWAALGFAAAWAMRWYTFRQLKAERDHQLADRKKELELQLQSFELELKQQQMRRLNGHAGGGGE